MRQVHAVGERKLKRADVALAILWTSHADLTALSPNGRQVIVRKSGHHIQVEQPEVVIDAIRQVMEIM